MQHELPLPLLFQSQADRIRFRPGRSGSVQPTLTICAWRSRKTYSTAS